MATFQERLKELRKAHKLKQAELAEKLGVSMFTVSVWERGQRMPEFDNLEALSSVLDVNIAYLLGASDDPSPKGVPSDEDFQKWETEDEMENLRLAFERITRLSKSSQSIILAAASQAYKEDKISGTLAEGYEVTVRPPARQPTSRKRRGRRGLLKMEFATYVATHIATCVATEYLSK